MDSLQFELKLVLFWIKQFINKFFKKRKMANALAEKIRALTASKIDFVNDEAEQVVEDLATATLELDDKADAFNALIGEDVDQEEVGPALVDLADLFDDVDLSAEQEAKLTSVVDRLVKSGTGDQRAAAKDLFTATLGYGLKAKAANEFFDTLLATEPE